MLRAAAALVLAVHGLIHFLGFVTSWKLARILRLPYTTTALWGHLQLGDAGARVAGLLCLFATFFFVAWAGGNS